VPLGNISKHINEGLYITTRKQLNDGFGCLQKCNTGQLCWHGKFLLQSGVSFTHTSGIGGGEREGGGSCGGISFGLLGRCDDDDSDGIREDD
jgi:hypothetical protein